MHQLWKKLTFWMDRKPTKVRFITRLSAYVIDWILGGIFTGLPAVFIYAAVSGKSDMFSNLYVFPSLGYSVYWSYLTGVLCLLFGFIYLIYIPYRKYPGQTLGKRFMKIKIARIDGQPLDLKTLLIRQFVGLILLEGVSTVVATYIRQMLTILTGIYLEYYLTAICSVVTVVSAVLVFNTPSARSIHDYLAKTTVILENDKIVQPSKRKKSKHR